MKCNVGGLDMMFRLIGGIILLAIAYSVPMAEWLLVVLVVVAAIALITGLARYCPANALLGFNTCKVKASGGQQQQVREAHHPDSGKAANH